MLYAEIESTVPSTATLLWKFVRCFYQCKCTHCAVQSKSAALSLKYVLIVYIWTEKDVKVKVKIRSNKGHQNKMLLSVVRHMFNESFRTQNSMVTFIVKFGPRKGQCQAKQGQIGQISKFIFLSKTCPSCPVLSHDFKNIINFYAWQLTRVPRRADSDPLPDFPDSSKTAADIDTKLSVPFSASIWRFSSKCHTILGEMFEKKAF